MVLLNAFAFIVEKFSFPSKFLSEFLKKNCDPLETRISKLDSGNWKLEPRISGYSIPEIIEFRVDMVNLPLTGTVL